MSTHIDVLCGHYHAVVAFRGPMIEVTEVHPPKREMYRGIADAARTYDGTEPVREVFSGTRRM